MPNVRPGEQDNLIKEMIQGKHGEEKMMLAKDHMRRLGYTEADQKYKFGFDKSKIVPMIEERKKALEAAGVAPAEALRLANLGAAGVTSKMAQFGGGNVMGKFEISGPLGPMVQELKKFLGMKSGYSSGRISQKHVVGILLIVSALMLLKRK